MQSCSYDLVCRVSDGEGAQCVVGEVPAAPEGHLVRAVLLLVLFRPVLLTLGLSGKTNGGISARARKKMPNNLLETVDGAAVLL